MTELELVIDGFLHDKGQDTIWSLVKEHSTIHEEQLLKKIQT